MGTPSQVLRVPDLRTTLTWSVLGLVFLLLIGQPLGFVDLGYHLRAGAWIWDHGRWLDLDLFTHTVQGSDWLNQNWLAQASLFAIWRSWGPEGLVLVNATLFTAGAALLLRTCVRRAGSTRAGVIAFLVGAAPAVVNTAVRPQAFSWLLLAIAFSLLEHVEAKPRLMLWLVPIVALGANLHGAFILVLALVAIEAAVRFVRHPWGRSPTFLWSLGVLGLGTIAGMINPWGFRVYEYVLGIGTNPTIRSQIDEWQAPGLGTAAGLLLFVSMAAVAVAALRSTTRLDARDLLRLGLIGGLSVVAIRNTLWWPIVAGPALATLSTGLGTAWRDPSIDRPRRSHVLILATVCALIVLASPWARIIKRPDSWNLASSDTPVAATAYLRSALTEGRLLNTQSFGSYLEWAAPALPTFVDSRIELFPDGIWTSYRSMMSATPGWDRLAARFGIGTVILAADKPPPLRRALETSADWDLVHQDQVATVWQRSDTPSRSR